MALTEDYEFEYDGVLIADCDYKSIVTARVFGSPDIRSSDQMRGQLDGLFPGLDLYAGRNIELELEVEGPDKATFVQNVRDVMAACRLRRSEALLRFRLPGWDEDLRVMCRPRKLAGLTLDTPFDLNGTTAMVQFFATDPRIYSDSLSVGSTGLIGDNSGMTFNATFPLTFGGITASNAISAMNTGNYETPWTATITGPITNPRIEHVGLGKVLQFNGTVNDGETLIVSSQPNSTVLLNGTASRYSWLLDAEQWFMLQPGLNEVRFLGTSAGNPTMSLEWRSAWA